MKNSAGGRLLHKLRFPYDFAKFYGFQGIGRAIRHPYYWVKHYPDRRRYFKNFAAIMEEDAAFDRKFGTDTSSRADLIDLGIPFESRKHGSYYGCINEAVFRDALRHIHLPDRNAVFVDLGSGKGKALLLATDSPFQRIIGVEFAADLCSIAEENVRRFQQFTGSAASRIECVYGDALEFDFPSSPLVIFMLNPFDEPIMVPVVERIRKSLADDPRPLWVIYANPRFRSLFDQAEWLLPLTENEYFCIWQSHDAASLGSPA